MRAARDSKVLKFWFSGPLHAKVFASRRRALIGSANFTCLGLGIGGANRNLEISVQLEDEAASLEIGARFDKWREANRVTPAMPHDVADRADAADMGLQELPAGILDRVSEADAELARSLVDEKYRGDVASSFIRKVYAILADAAVRKQPLTYVDLQTRLGMRALDEQHAKRLWSVLGAISEREHQRGRPLLGVMVGHRDGSAFVPGFGFFDKPGSLVGHRRDGHWAAEYGGTGEQRYEPGPKDLVFAARQQMAASAAWAQSG